MTPKQETFYKLMTVHLISKKIQQAKQTLEQELYAKATDPILCKRRFRMLSQLAQYESQVYKKIYRFRADSIDDYVLALWTLARELDLVVNRNA